MQHRTWGRRIWGRRIWGTTAALALGLVHALAGAAVADQVPAAPPSATFPNGAASGLPAGDYQLTVRVSAARSGSEAGEVTQLVGGAGTPERIADYHATPAGTVVTGAVRLTGPADTVTVSADGPVSVGLLTLRPAAFGYVVRGTTLTSPAASRVTLHGVSAINDMTAASEDNIDRLHSTTRASLVRVPVDECEWLPWSAAYQPRYRQQIADTVRAITNDHMTAIVDLHYACHDDPRYVPDSAMSPQVGPDQHSIAFWKDAAGLFAGNQLVMFELFNEPKMNAGDTEPDGHTGAQTWRDGGVLAYRGAQWRSPGMEALYSAVRATGATNVVLVDGTSWASSLLPAETAPLDGTDIAYAFHAYTNPGENPATYPAHLDTSVGPVISPTGRFRQAGIATEVGTTVQDSTATSTGSDFFTSVARWVAAERAVGWAAWGWYPTSYDAYGLLRAWPTNATSRGNAVRAAF